MPEPFRILASVLLLGGCVAAPESPPAPPPVPVQPAAPPPAPLAADWQEWPVTPGDWSYGDNDRGSVATYSSPRGPGRTRLVWVNCLREGRDIAITGLAGTGPLTVRTSSMTRTVPAARPTEGWQFDRSLLPARDPLLDAIAFSRGRFVLQRAGAPPLVLPAHAEIARVIEDCRG